MSMTLPIWICRAICTSTCWAKLATAGQNGQFRTPKHIREMMVELLQPTSDDTICDKIIAELIQAYGKRNPSKPYKIRASRFFCVVEQRLIAWERLMHAGI